MYLCNFLITSDYLEHIACANGDSECLSDPATHKNVEMNWKISFEGNLAHEWKRAIPSRMRRPARNIEAALWEGSG